MKLAFLVYQCGLANVFINDGVGPKRVMQHAFGPCEYFARGLKYAGYDVEVRHCDKAGDIAAEIWAKGRGETFADAKTNIV